MASFNKINSFVEATAKKIHNLGSDQIVIALTNTTPVVTDTQLSDITEIAYTFLSTRNVTTTSSLQTAGLYKLILVDLVLTSTGGSTGPFRYIVLYNDTATNNELIGWYDHGSSITLDSGDTHTTDFDGTGGVLTIQ